MKENFESVFDNFGDDVLDENVLNVSDDEAVEVDEEEVVKDTKAVVVDNKKEVSVPEFNFDFSKLGNIAGVVTGDIGLTISKYPVDKLKFSCNKRERISIITEQVIAIKTHYIENIGSILCFDGKCCKIDGAARIKYLFPVVVYDTNAQGKAVSTKIQNKVLAVGRGVYEDIMAVHEINEEIGGVSAVDLVVSCKEEQYQDISIQPAGKASWKKKPELVKQVTEFWSKNMNHIYESVAREISEEDFNLKLGDTGVLSDSDVDFNDVFGE